MVLDFARAKIPILCEKPIATKCVDAREMLAICEANEVPLGICFPVRFSEPLRQAKRVVEQGSLGQVVAVKATNHGTMPGDWFVDPQLSGGGAVMDHAVHVVDALRWLFEAEFTQVFAHAANRLHPIPVEDVGLLTLEMSNEVFVTLDTSWSRPNRSFPIWGDVTIEIVGTRGVISLDLFPWTLNYYSESAGKHLADARDGDLSLRMLENFVGMIEGRAKLSATGLDGLRALEVVEAAYKSIATRQVVSSAVTLEMKRRSKFETSNQAGYSRRWQYGAALGQGLPVSSPGFNSVCLQPHHGSGRKFGDFAWGEACNGDRPHL